MNETMNANNANAPTTLKTNLLYALSSVAENPLFTLMMGFLTFFYTDTIGINPAIVGTILMVSRFMDGISDLIAGNIVDHTHTKYGQARPWFLRLMIPVAFAYVVLFTVPNCGTAGKIAYIFISYNLVSTVIYTMFKAAQAVYPTFLTKNRVSRSIMSTMYLFGACAAQMILMMFGIRFVEALGGGQSGWIKFAAILGAIAGAIMLIIFLFTKEMNDGEEEVKQQENVPFKTAILSLLKNKYWFILLATFFAGVIIQVCTLTDGVYYAKYVLSSESIRKKFSAQSTGTSGSMFNVSSEKFRNISLPVPSRALQDDFEGFVHQVDKSKSAVQKALDEVQLLFDSLMQQYFG